MNTIDFSYSIVFQCDSRTALSVALSLLAAIATAVALGVLAHYGYITPTAAYATAPAVGTVLTLLGVAIALIRKDKPKYAPIPNEVPRPRKVTPSANTQSQSVRDPTPIKRYFDGTITVQLVPYRPNTDFYLRKQRPTQDAPYHCLKVQIALDGTTEPVEVEVLEVGYYGSNCYKMRFQYQDIEYQKEITNGSGVEAAWKEHVKNAENLLLRGDYQRLIDPHGPATLLMFTEENNQSSGKTYFSQKEFPQVAYKGKVVTFTRTHTTPIRSLQGLDEFPEICALLQARSWTWEAPYDIKLIEEDPQRYFHSQQEWVSRYRVEWQISDLEVTESLRRAISLLESSL